MLSRYPRLPLVIFVGLLFVWGYSWVLLKLAMRDAGPFQFAGLRTFIGALALLAALPILKRPLWPARWRETIALGVVQTGLFVGLSQWSLVQGGAGQSAVLVFTMPFWTLIFAAAILGERIVGVQRWAVALAAVGLTMILQPWALGGTVMSKVIAVAAGATWAASAVMAKQIQNRGPIDLVALTAWQMLVGSILLMMVAAVVGEPAVQWNLRFTSILLFTALVPTGLGWLVWLYLLRRLSAGVAGMSMLAIPVLATVSSAVQLHERLAPHEYVGIAAIVVALVTLSSSALRNTPSTSRG